MVEGSRSRVKCRGSEKMSRVGKNVEGRKYQENTLKFGILFFCCVPNMYILIVLDYTVYLPLSGIVEIYKSQVAFTLSINTFG